MVIIVEIFYTLHIKVNGSIRVPHLYGYKHNSVYKKVREVNSLTFLYAFQSFYKWFDLNRASYVII